MNQTEPSQTGRTAQADSPAQPRQTLDGLAQPRQTDGTQARQPDRQQTAQTDSPGSLDSPAQTAAQRTADSPAQTQTDEPQTANPMETILVVNGQTRQTDN